MTVAPEPGDDGWTVAAPEAAGLDPALLAGLAPQFEAWPEAKLHAVLIARRGRLAYERYFTGSDQRWGQPLGRVSYRADLRHDLRSVTKSIVGLLAGIGVERGWLPDLDAPVFGFFPEHAGLRTPQKDAIVLRHLLTMSAGLAWNEDLPYGDPGNSERQMSVAPDRSGFVLGQPLVRPPGAVWRYNGGLTWLLAEVLARSGGAPVEALAQEALFAPLGIADLEWVRYADGAANPVSGLRLRPRDLLKIGQCVLDGGLWQDHRVVPQGWVAESLTPQINGQGLYFYGYHWWLGRSLVRRREILWAAATGWGGQRLYIVPALDLVVAVLAGLYDDPPLQPLVPEIVLRRYALEAAVAA